MQLEIFKLIDDSQKNGFVIFHTNEKKTIHWDKSHCVFIENNATEKDIEEFLENSYRELDSLKIVKIYFEDSTLIDSIERVFGEQKCKLYNRIIFKYKEIRDIKNMMNETILDTHKIIEDGEGFDNYDALVAEIFNNWGSIEQFINSGFGVCKIIDKTIAGWCLSEYNSSSKCGIGIETIENYQNRGIGTGMAMQFLMKCKEKEITPYWDSWKWNKASVKIALKLSFMEVQEYQTYMVIF